MPPIDGPTQYTWHTEHTEHTGDPEDAQTKVYAFISKELGDFETTQTKTTKKFLNQSNKLTRETRFSKGRIFPIFKVKF